MSLFAGLNAYSASDTFIMIIAQKIIQMLKRLGRFRLS
jgi:hypothetical protein